LMIFAIMLTHQLYSKSIRQVNEQVIPATLVVLAFFALSVFTLIKTAWPISGGVLPANNIAELGKLLLSEYVIPFEVVSIVLLVALIGAIVISKKDKEEAKQ
jgi:NADH-quinone oxidoreductase subunit J